VTLARAGLALAPASPALWAHLGAAQLERLRSAPPAAAAAHGAQALEAFERALALDPDQPLAAVNRFITLRLLGRGDDALVAARELSLRWPDEPLVLHNLGAWHQAEGRHAEAVPLFARELATGHAHSATPSMLQESQRALEPAPGQR
jgi:Flp pilus assembly protein TadD